MNALEIRNLVKNFKSTQAVNNLNITVKRGMCYGLFGRNGAGKTTTIKCLLNLLKPDKGDIQIFGMNPRKNEVGVKTKLSYVPEVVGFYPWMTVRETLDYFASFRKHWNKELEKDLLERFELEPKKKVTNLSRGMKAQLSLLCAICPEAELLILDEPTSGLDPIVRREFIQTVIGAFQEGDPENRTVFVSTHMISEFEGLIDEFTIMENGKNLLTMESDQARKEFKSICLRFRGSPPEINSKLILTKQKEGNEIVLTTHEFNTELEQYLRSLSPDSVKIGNLSLEEIFVNVSCKKGAEK